MSRTSLIYSHMGFKYRMLFDALHWSEEEDHNRVLDAVEKSMALIRKMIFRVIIG